MPGRFPGKHLRVGFPKEPDAERRYQISRVLPGEAPLGLSIRAAGCPGPLPADGPPTMQAFAVALLNQKGGVGKTSTCHHLAGTFSKGGRRVLLIDADPQASLTQGFWGPDTMRSLPRRATIAALFDDGIPPGPAELIRSTDFPGVDLLPGSEFLNSHNLPDPENDPRQVVLRDLVDEVRASTMSS